jgi:Domain of unknown function (DUF4417)
VFTHFYENFFDSDNEWGIPSLDIALQAKSLTQPFLPWGAVARQRLGLFPQAAHFYVDDYKFDALWKRPEKLLSTGILEVVEPNFSIPDDAPKALALYQIYRKRYLAKYWQFYGGVNIFCDLNVGDRFLDFALLGVPLSWNSYACRGHSDKPLSELLTRWELAKSHSCSNSPYFVVYAGGNKVRAICEEYSWHYFDTFRGKF